MVNNKMEEHTKFKGVTTHLLALYFKITMEEYTKFKGVTTGVTTF